MPKAELIFKENPVLEEVRFLEDRLYDFNVAATGISDGRSLAIFVPGEDGSIRAGLSGHTWGRCCEIKQIWVEGVLPRARIGQSSVGSGRNRSAQERLPPDPT